jgi:hypothetical protein
LSDVQVLGLAFLFVVDGASATRHAGERAVKSGGAAAAGKPGNSAAHTTEDLAGAHPALRYLFDLFELETLWSLPSCTV